MSFRALTSLSRPAVILTALTALAVPLGACPGAQVKPSSGEVKVVLRRIDVVEANYSRMKLNVIVAIENGTGDDVQASADATIAITGEAKDDAEGGDAAADSGEGGVAEAVEQAEEAEAKAEGGAATPVDGQRHAGTGSGRAAAFNTSELPIVVDMPLPSDPALLEQVLDWKKMLIHVEGNVKVGLQSYRLGGEREVAPPRLPDVKLKDAQVASVDGGTAGTGFFTVILDNKNPFEVTVDRLAWTITVGGKELKPSSGSTEAENDAIPASAVGEYGAEVQIDEAAFGKELKALLKNPTVPYVIEGKMEVRGIQRTFRFQGDMKFAR